MRGGLFAVEVGRRTGRPAGEEILLVVERQRRIGGRRPMRLRVRGRRRRHDGRVQTLYALTAAVG